MLSAVSLLQVDLRKPASHSGPGFENTSCQCLHTDVARTLHMGYTARVTTNGAAGAYHHYAVDHLYRLSDSDLPFRKAQMRKYTFYNINRQQCQRSAACHCMQQTAAELASCSRMQCAMYSTSCTPFRCQQSTSTEANERMTVHVKST